MTAPSADVLRLASEVRDAVETDAEVVAVTRGIEALLDPRHVGIVTSDYACAVRRATVAALLSRADERR